MNDRLIDNFGRSYKYLRISVTDRCNYRCKYCFPTNGFTPISHEDILTYEELLYTIEVFSKLGIEKIRITGGEPLVRKDIFSFINKVTLINGIQEVTLTTNGSLLKKYTNKIYNSGIKRINISLDSLHSNKYSYITGGFNINAIFDGIKTAKEARLNPIKINTVLVRGFNNDEILDFCEFASESGVIVRFIEFMPIGNNVQWTNDKIISGKEVIDTIASKYDIKALQHGKHDGPAKNYLLSNGATIGVITPISNHFCNTCDKLRLTSNGKIRPCLLSDMEYDIKEFIKNREKEKLIHLIKHSLLAKHRTYDLQKNSANKTCCRTMPQIGG